ncbi:hypothetical protein MTO96_034540 [Rhipicephalus appendiculatus]
MGAISIRASPDDSLCVPLASRVVPGSLKQDQVVGRCGWAAMRRSLERSRLFTRSPDITRCGSAPKRALSSGALYPPILGDGGAARASFTFPPRSLAPFAARTAPVAPK